MAEDAKTDKAPSVPWSAKLKFVGIGLLIGGLAGGGGAGKVYYDGWTKQTSMQETMDRLQARQGLFETQAAISAASIELRRDNFGDAKSSVNTARTRLGTISADAAKIDGAVLKTIQERLDAINIAASGDSAQPSSALDDVNLALDRLINPVP